MKQLKSIALKLAEFRLIGAVIFYWISSVSIFNPIAIGMLVLLLIQIRMKNRKFGLVLAALLILVSTFMLQALRSEFTEFNTFNTEAQKLLFVGLSLFGTSLIVSGIMIYKYHYAKK